MTSQTKQFILMIVSTIAALGVIGYLIYQVGVLDVMVYLVINTALIFVMMLVVMGIMNPDTYNLINEELSGFYYTIVEKFFGKKDEETAS